MKSPFRSRRCLSNFALMCLTLVVCLSIITMAQSDRTLSATPKRQVLRNVSMQSGMGEAVQAGLAEVERVVLAEIYA